VKDPKDLYDEDDPLGWLGGIRSLRQRERAGILYAFGLGLFLLAFGLKMQFWPKPPEEAQLALPFVLVGISLLLAAWGTRLWRHMREKDGRWG
jgi:uncharacterized membrane protein